jgi:hypothetical protein
MYVLLSIELIVIDASVPIDVSFVENFQHCCYFVIADNCILSENAAVQFWRLEGKSLSVPICAEQFVVISLLAVFDDRLSVSHCFFGFSTE